MGIVKSPEKAGSKAVSASQKLELWGYNANLVFRDGENIVRAFFRLVAGAALMFGRTWTCSTTTER